MIRDLGDLFERYVTLASADRDHWRTYEQTGVAPASGLAGEWQTDDPEWVSDVCLDLLMATGPHRRLQRLRTEIADLQRQADRLERQILDDAEGWSRREVTEPLPAWCYVAGTPHAGFGERHSPAPTLRLVPQVNGVARRHR